MGRTDLWRKYCVFYEKSFSKQLAYNKERMKKYFEKWRKTDLAKMLCRTSVKNFRDAPITVYSDYPMLTHFANKISDIVSDNLSFIPV